MRYFTFRNHVNEMIANNNGTADELCEQICNYTLDVIREMDGIKDKRCFVNLATKKMETIKGNQGNETIDSFITSLELYLACS